ncbi:hypothetical protein EDC01DRAFT_684300 [Geopyxis carbonaria]|nr:hypothetical protein EDC01DRAFT_684300 [Geopyxis carbonaria]
MAAQCVPDRSTVLPASKSIRCVWGTYNRDERVTILLHILGAMMYKIGCELFTASITTMTLQRWALDAGYRKLGLLNGINLVFQFLGTMVAPVLLRRMSIREALFYMNVGLASIPAVFLIMNFATGGHFKPNVLQAEIYGSWPLSALFALFSARGVCDGVVELVKRVTCRHIVGIDLLKLRQVDSVTHIFENVAGIGGALLSALIIVHLGTAFCMVGVLFCNIFAAVFWWRLGQLGYEKSQTMGNLTIWQFFVNCIIDFWLTIRYGMELLFKNRKFCWLPVSYSLSLYAHRFIENGLMPVIAQDYLMEPSYLSILICGSNLGEFLGAMIVLGVGKRVSTPILWLRLDSVMLLLVWILPFYKDNQPMDSLHAWALATMLIPMSFSWAAGEVSLVAYIPSTLPEMKSDASVIPLDATLASLSSMYIALFAILTPILGDYADSIGRKSPNKALYDLGGIQLTVIAILLFINTFVPKGALKFNPKVLGAGPTVLEEDVEMNTRTKDFQSRDDENCCPIPCIIGVEVDEVSYHSPPKRLKVRFETE